MAMVLFPNSLHSFEVSGDIPKDTPATIYHGFLNFPAPISLKQKDVIVIDLMTGKPELVQRRGIVVWRDCWKN